MNKSARKRKSWRKRVDHASQAIIFDEMGNWAMEYHLNCTCGLGRVYRTLGTARAMRTRFAGSSDRSRFYHDGCGGTLTITLTPEDVITDEDGRIVVPAREKIPLATIMVPQRIRGPSA
jgi:hypothetical protein